MARQDYVNISRGELEDWLDSNFGSWSRVGNQAGVYLIELSDRVAVKLSSTQKNSGGAVSKGNASMNLSLISLVDGTLLNRKARDRKYFQRTKNWKVTWKKGVDHWISIYEDKDEFYEKIADRKGYKTKWIGMINSLPSGGSDREIIKSRETLEGGSVLWANQERYILEAIKASRTRSTPTPSNTLDVAKLRDLYRKARSEGNRDDMKTIKDLGLKARDGITPSSQEQQTYNSLRLRYRM
jgi:hypothetical protein